ncbi:MAG TPA: hypothetical protein PKM88_04500 [bacterium]|nr:hypothetical protein [bacterium]
MNESAPAAVTLPSPRRWPRLLAAGAALLLLLALGISLALYWLADPEEIRQTLEQQLGRQVRLTGIAPGFFAITARGLEIADTAGFNPDPLLTLESASISPDWGALLTGKLQISRLTLRQAKLGVEFDSAGACNLAGLIKPSSGGGTTVSIEELTFDNCAVSVSWPQRQFALAGLSGTLGHLDAEPYAIDLTGAVSGGTLRCSGTAAPATGTLALRLQTEALPLTAFGLAPGTLPDSAALTTDLALALADSRATISGSGAAPALLRAFTLELAAPWPLPAAADSAAPPVSGTLTATADVGDLRGLPLLAPALTAIDGRGTVTAALDLNGSGRYDLTDIQLSFVDCSLAVAALKDRLQNLSGPFSVSDRALTLGSISFTVGGLPFTGNGSIGFSPFALDLAISGSGLDLARAAALPRAAVIPAGITVGGSGNARLAVTTRTGATSVSGTISLAGAQATLASPALGFTGMTGDIAFGSDGVRLNSVSAQTCGGTVRAGGSIGSGSRLPFAVTLTGSNLGLAPLLTALVGPHAQGGTLDCSLQLAGDSMLTASYNGGGWLKLNRPQFTDAAVFTKLAPYLGIKDPGLLARYDSGVAAFTLSRGVLTFAQPMQLSNATVALAATGGIDLAGPLSLRGQVRVPNRSLAGVIGGIPLSQLAGVGNEGDKTVIGFKIGGTMNAPSFGVDGSVNNLLSAIVNTPAAVAGSSSALLQNVLGGLGITGSRRDTGSTPAAVPSAPAGTAPVNPFRELRNLFRR